MSPHCSCLSCVILCTVLITFVVSVHSSCVSCPDIDQSAYNVHIIPHSHMDVGWLKTPQQYFYGTQARGRTDSALQYVFDSVITELQRNDKRRFIFVEIAFLKMWWDHRDGKQHDLFRKLVDNGQIEFVGGGISMNDEACSYYEHLIDQMSFGLEILRAMFGSCGAVETGWQVDSYGHSKQFSLLVKKMNFKRMFFGRVDYREKAKRENEKNLEFIWQLDESHNMTVSITPNKYESPPGFCFDKNCKDKILVDDKKSDEYNIESRVEEFIEFVETYSKFYRFNHLLVTMGANMQYQNALKWFSNLDTLINFINGNNYTIDFNGKKLKLKLLYSTPTCYARNSFELNSGDLNINQADFFPYAEPDNHSYWTGYFTSRPSFKYIVRWAGNIVTAVSRILPLFGGDINPLSSLRLSLGVAQHHNAVTGTSRQAINNYYIKMISQGVNETLQSLQDYIGRPLMFCENLNISKCDVTEHLVDNTTAIAYNSLSFNISTILRFPVSTCDVIIRDENGGAIRSSCVSISDAVRNLAERQSDSNYELVVPVNISAMTYRQLLLERSGIIRNEETRKQVEEVTVHSLKNVDVAVDRHGLKWANIGGMKIGAAHTFSFYNSSCKFFSRRSGAYVFRPTGPKTDLEIQSSTSFQTATYSEYQLSYGNGIDVNVRFFYDQSYVELDWIIGPINISNHVGKELVMSIDTDIESDDVFYTDSNGRDLVKRIRNKRENWNLEIVEAESGNYYPINSRIQINDSNSHLTVLTDRAQGASSLNSGSVEIMLHRRCLCDDGFGVNEPLNEPGFNRKGLQVRGTLRLYFGKSPDRASDLLLQNPSFVFFTHNKIAMPDPLINLGELGNHVHVLTFYNNGDEQYLIRLENLLNQNVVINMSSIFSKSTKSIELMDLSGLGRKRDVDCMLTFEANDILTFIVKFF